MKKITQEQINTVMKCLEFYNIGIKDFISISKMFESLPVIEDVK